MQNLLGATTMSEPERPDPIAEANDRREQRMMWIFSAVIALVILGGMGANMLFHHETPATSSDTDVSAQSRPAQ
jgi:hypothetical protein